MPNWCYANINLKGTPKNIKSFCKLFVFEEEHNTKKGKYFARSFINQSWKDFNKEIKNKKEIDFIVEFAWSCWSCVFEGYPNNKECVTLEWACKKYNVEVLINTEEGGMCFEESISGDKEGVVYNSNEMPSYKCLKCGNTQAEPTDINIEDLTCWECETEGKFKLIK